ncbi:SURF1 family protein [Rhodopila sp.]|uniref:SURF1 family protein n=1 Tax=Rhodopila sp. TaxID=2480087 RepID=UPI003D0C1FB0
MKPARRRFLIPGVTVVVMLAMLIGLGTWQVYRLHWKERIMARIAVAEAAPPIPLQPDPQPYTKIAVTGRFRYDLAAQFGAEVRDTSAGPTMGNYQIVPLERADAPPILVDRGWVPQMRQAPLDDPPGQVTVAGYVRPTEKPHWFSPVDDLATRQFYTLDTATIAMALRLPAPLPFTLIALGPASSIEYPVPAQTLPRPPNNHLTYAITWYGLAVALIVIFIVWARKPSRT